MSDEEQPEEGPRPRVPVGRQHPLTRQYDEHVDADGIEAAAHWDERIWRQA